MVRAISPYTQPPTWAISPTTATYLMAGGAALAIFSGLALTLPHYRALIGKWRLTASASAGATILVASRVLSQNEPQAKVVAKKVIQEANRRLEKEADLCDKSHLYLTLAYAYTVLGNFEQAHEYIKLSKLTCDIYFASCISPITSPLEYRLPTTPEDRKAEIVSQTLETIRDHYPELHPEEVRLIGQFPKGDFFDKILKNPNWQIHYTFLPHLALQFKGEARNDAINELLQAIQSTEDGVLQMSVLVFLITENKFNKEDTKHHQDLINQMIDRLLQSEGGQESLDLHLARAKLKMHLGDAQESLKSLQQAFELKKDNWDYDNTLFFDLVAAQPSSTEKDTLIKEIGEWVDEESQGSNANRFSKIQACAIAKVDPNIAKNYLAHLVEHNNDSYNMSELYLAFGRYQEALDHAPSQPSATIIDLIEITDSVFEKEPILGLKALEKAAETIAKHDLDFEVENFCDCVIRHAPYQKDMLHKILSLLDKVKTNCYTFCDTSQTALAILTIRSGEHAL